jgi:predicted kinase
MLYFSVGISGSGKSTYFKNRFLSEYPVVNDILNKYSLKLSDIIVCPDDIRVELYNDINSKKRKYLFEEIKDRIENLIEKYNVAIFDGVNLSKSGLNYIYKLKSEHKTAIVFKPDIELSKYRIEKQLKNGENRANISNEVLEKQLQNFKLKVIYDENWNGIWDDNTKNKIIKHFKNRFPNVYFID